MSIKDTKSKKVIVAMSGGVDSSVAAALLKKQGYDVAGIFMHFWAEPKSSAENKCCSSEAEGCARAVAAKLGIPFYVWHFEKEFKKAVVDYFLAEYQKAHTPNPCVVCNQKIKFGLFLKKALALGAGYIAMGHYACVKNNKLFSAKDKKKDQSYFLYNLTQKGLSSILFPLGDYQKSEVYQMAKKWGLPYRQKEAFDICFIAGKDHNEFLKKYLKLRPGKIISKTPPHPSPYQGEGWGGVLGQHQGLSLYTIGQKAQVGGPGPYYVVGFNRKNNDLFVTKNPNE